MDVQWAVSRQLLQKVAELMPVGGTILELGSGYSTQWFVEQGYQTYSIEHDTVWLNRVPGAHYIYAPIKPWGPGNRCPASIRKHFPNATGWYSTRAIGGNLPPKYDLILVDGPGRDVGRAGFIANIKLFDKTVPIVLDDMNRNDDLLMARMVAEKVNRDLLITNNKPGHKPFGII